MTAPKRSRRRADLARMKAKAKRLYPHDAKAKNAEHLAACSCAMCGNPRRFEKASLTVQEMKAAQAGAIDYDAIYEDVMRRFPVIMARLAE